MPSRRLLAALILLGAGGSISSPAFARPGAILGAAPGAGAGFNILLVTLDTTRADRLGCYGHAGAATPVLDRLAAGGIRFEEAVTVAPETLPAHATLLTGLLPPRHGVRINAESRLESRHTRTIGTLRQFDVTASVGQAVVARGTIALSFA